MWLWIACGAAALVVATAALLRLWVDLDGGTLFERFATVLVAVALLLASLLAVPRRPRLAWAVVTLAGALGAIEALGVVRALQVGVVRGPVTTLGGAVALAAVGIALGYATVRRAGDGAAWRLATIAVWLAALASVVVIVWATAPSDALDVPRTSPDELSPLRIAVRVALVAIAGAFLLGVARDVVPAASRAAAHLRTSPESATGDRDRLWRFLTAFADELTPGRAEARARVAEGERARIAADLHAYVLPELRRAALAAAEAGAAEGVQVDLRRALEDVEQLMHERQSVVLEQFGLVAALEWLAERTEERSQLRVELELDGSVPDGPTGVDRGVARAAFRIALLALDNVVRHAHASTATVGLSTGPAGLRLTVRDDGTIPTDLDREPRSGRGLADMRAEAAATGGAVVASGGTGARIEATWPRRR
jgi:signal transduction histidine kinase